MSVESQRRPTLDPEAEQEVDFGRYWRTITARWWLALADSDAGLWARGAAVYSGLDVTVREPDVHPVQVQGPKSKDEIRTLFGDAVADLRSCWTAEASVDGIPVVVNYGSDMTIENNPFEVSGLERLVEPQEANYIGKAALERIRVEGVSRKLVGLEVDGAALPFEIAEKRPALQRGEPVGIVTDLIWSPRLERNVGYVWVPIELAEPGNDLEIRGSDGSRAFGRTAALPFIDPKKQVPLG